MSLRDRIEYFVFLGRHEGWENSRLADALLSDPEIAALIEVAERARYWGRVRAPSGHRRATRRLLAALARLEEARRG